MLFFSFINTVKASHFRINSVNIRGDESVVSVNHPEEIHNHAPSSKLFWKMGIGFQFWNLRINGVFLYCFLNTRKVNTSPHLKTSVVAVHCIQNKDQNSE